MKTSFYSKAPKLFSTYLLLFSSTILFAQVGIGTVTPDDDLDVIGNTQVSGYLRVGDPAVPQATTANGVTLLLSSGSSDNFGAWSQTGCNTTFWVTNVLVNDDGFMSFDTVGARANQYLYSPHIWIPSSATEILVEIVHAFQLQNLRDGVYLEYSTDNGSSWNSITTFLNGGYTGTATGSNATCSGNGAATNAWTAGPSTLLTLFTLTESGTWIQFRFTGTENQNTDSGLYELYSFNVIATNSGSTGGAFSAGNLYAENNVYAGSNVLLGDLAEYFPVKGTAEPGDIISYSSAKEDIYTRSTKENDEKIIGVYSTNPTLTLNNPNVGLPVALQGRVPINVIGEPFSKGDYLTSSSRPGKGQKAVSSGFVVGRAMEDFEGGSGQVICLIETGWRNLSTTHNQLSGINIFPENSKSIFVSNPGVSASSKVFVSFNSDIGSRHWVEKIEGKGFEIHLDQPAKRNTSFDYLIDQAAISNVNASVVSKKSNLSTQNLNQNKPAKTNLIPMREDTMVGQPPAVPDTEKPYTWTPEGGLIERSVDQN